ncbi:MAG: hypothetical protein C4576_08005 [Desulfobacteraceae bacterium]|nr:MAG: hypothetical protein C4576_08005 [Desulfobacteraceae bacterium]
MHTITKSFAGLLLFSLIVLPLSGCDTPPWESGRVLNLKVDAPQDKSTVTSSSVMVNGRVSGSQAAGAKVAINGGDIPVKEKKFSGNISLKEGKNVINVAASSGGASLIQTITVTYAPTKQ